MRQKVIVIEDIDQSKVDKTIVPLLEEGYVIQKVLSENVSSGQSYTRRGKIIFILRPLSAGSDQTLHS